MVLEINSCLERTEKGAASLKRQLESKDGGDEDIPF